MRVTLYSDGNYNGFENGVKFPLVFHVDSDDVKLLGSNYGIELKESVIPQYLPEKGQPKEGDNFLPDSDDGYLYFCPDEYEIF